jgi:hypothetical protein
MENRRLALDLGCLELLPCLPYIRDLMDISLYEI